MLRYIIGVSLITIGIIVVRALSNGKVLKKHQYAFWIVIPLYMILSPFIKFELPSIDLMKPAASAEIETTEYEEVTDAPSVITIGNTQAGHSNSNNNQAVIRETEKDSQAVTRPVQTATQNAPVSEVKTKNTFKADTVLKYISSAVSAALIVFLLAYNIGFVIYCRRRREYAGKDPESGLKIWRIRNNRAPFLLFNKIYVDSDSKEINEYVIRHEASHYKHGDFIWVMVRYIVLFLNWYNPLIWAAFFLSGRDCELACDEEVLRSCGKDSSVGYVETLFGLLRQHSGMPFAFSVSTGMGAGYETMKKRIVSIKKPAHNSRKALAFSLAAILLFTSCSFANTSEAGTIKSGDTWFNAKTTMIDNQYNNEKLDGYEVEICGVYKDGILLSTYGYSYTSSENNFENLEYYDFNGKLINSIDISELTESRQIENIAACDNGVRLTLKDTISDANNPELKSFEVSIDLSSGVIGDLEESSNTPGDYGLDSDFHYDGTWTIGDYSVSHYSTWNKRNAFVISNNGKIKTVDMSVDPEFKDVGVENYIIVSEKEILLVCFSNKVRFLSLDLETGKLEDKDEEYAWLNTVNYATRISSFDGKTYITDQSGIKCINFESKELEEVVSFNDCNINRSIISRFDLVSVEDDRYVLAGTVNTYDAYTMFDSSDKEIPAIIVLEKADKNPNAGKLVLTAATVGRVETPYPISEAIRKFNDTNKKYFIRIESELNVADYFDFSNAESHDDSDDVHYNGTSALSAQLATDLLSGNAPDIILNAGDYSLIHSEDYLVDLTAYTNGKNGIKEADYFSNVLDAAKTGDKLFYMPVSFTVKGILADKADVRDGMTGFTFDEYAEFLYGPCNGRDPMNETQLGALCTLYSYMSDTCIQGKEVNFDNESFRALCDYIKANVSDLSYDPNESNGYGSYYNFAEFMLVNGNNASEKTIMGYPSPDGRGPEISVGTSIGISAEASSAVADGAWEFIKYCLGDEVQEMIARHDENPLSIKAFDTSAKIVLENYNSNNINPFTFTKIEPQDEGVIATYKNVLLSASVTDNIDPAILIVLREELPPYFLDQKSFDDVLKIIQDRVSTIIAERK
ncbi:MAG: extracellular solute-binding protein [Clostridiales bacterium]|nr:extracellular solute-binding protein [Clostridiales bacterium]